MSSVMPQGRAPEDELAEAQRERDTPGQPDEPAFQALTASAHFDRVLYDGGEFGTATAAGSPEEEDFLGLPGLLEPDQVRSLLAKRQQSQLTARSAATPPPHRSSSPASPGSSPATPPQRPQPRQSSVPNHPAPTRRPAAPGDPSGPGRPAQGAERPGRRAGATAPASRTA